MDEPHVPERRPKSLRRRVAHVLLWGVTGASVTAYLVYELVDNYGLSVAQAFAVTSPLLILIAGENLWSTGLHRLTGVEIPSAAFSVTAMVISVVLVFVLTRPEPEPVTGDLIVIAQGGGRYSSDLTHAPGPFLITLTNLDDFDHAFVIERIGLRLDTTSYRASRADVDLAPGKYEYFCDLPGYSGMKGTLTIR